VLSSSDSGIAQNSSLISSAIKSSFYSRKKNCLINFILLGSLIFSYKNFIAQEKQEMQNQLKKFLSF